MADSNSINIAPIDLRAIERSSSPNDSLACAPNVCAAKADFASPVYALSRKTLMQTAEAVLLAEPRTEVVARDETLPQIMFVQKSRTFGFADTIRVQTDGEDGHASLIIHSRSNTGYWDLGVNRKRVRRLLDELAHRLSNGSTPPAQG